MQGITMKGISKVFYGKTALEDVDIAFKKGTIHAIVGENGAGKSTLMNILSGVLEPSVGRIYIDEEEQHFKQPQDSSKAGIGMVYQHFMLAPTLKVWQNVILGNEPCTQFGSINKALALKKINDTCEKYGLELNPEQVVATMTVGEQQRIEILKVIMRDSSYIILDEPTAVLTPQETAQLCDNIKFFKSLGKTIIFISHKLEEVMDIADEITVLRRGKKITTIPIEEANAESLVEMMVGHEVDLTGYPLQVTTGRPVLEVKNVCTNRTDFSSGLQKINFTLHEGEVIGIAGVDGNGQTELVDAILGMVKISSGTILKDGNDITEQSYEKTRSKGLSLIPPDRQKEGLVLSNNLMMNLAMGCEKDPRFCKGGMLSMSSVKQNAEEIFKEYDVRMSSLEARASDLSGGNQQKLILAREFAVRNSNLIVAVNPTRGLDVGAIEFVYNRLEEQKKTGKAILLVSTELTEIMRLSDRIAVFFKGKCMTILPRETATIEEIGSYMMGIEGKEEH